MRSITTLLIAACLAGALLLAQTDRGAIRGSIVDATGAAVPGAQVVAANKGTQIRMTVLSLAPVLNETETAEFAASLRARLLSP